MQKHINNLSNDTIPLTTQQEEEARKLKRMTTLSDFAGSMKDTWKEVDALEYQKNLREEKTIT